LKNLSNALLLSSHLGPNRRHFSNKLTVSKQSRIHGGGGGDVVVVVVIVAVVDDDDLVVCNKSSSDTRHRE